MLLCCRFVVAQAPKENPATSGNAFARICSVIDKEASTGTEVQYADACIGYVQGVIEGVDVERTFTKGITQKEAPEPFCLPTGVERGQSIRLVIKYIHDHPEEAQKPTRFLIFEAFRDAYPCLSK
jgi:hypothetical protein